MSLSTSVAFFSASTIKFSVGWRFVAQITSSVEWLVILLFTLTHRTMTALQTPKCCSKYLTMQVRKEISGDWDVFQLMQEVVAFERQAKQIRQDFVVVLACDLKIS